MRYNTPFRGDDWLTICLGLTAVLTLILWRVLK
jgi:hypothetical protein